MMILKLAWRSLWRNSRRTAITVSSIAFGTVLAVFFISMGDGMYKKLIDEAVRMNAGHVTIQNVEYGEAPAVDLFVPSVEKIRQAAAQIPEVQDVKALIVGQAVVSTGSGSGGVGLIGVDPLKEAQISPIARSIVEGRYLQPGDTRGVVLGQSLAERLRLGIGNKLVVTTNDVHGELVGEMLRVTGIFESGMEEADGFLIQVPLDVARRIFDMGPDQATQVGLILENPDNQEKVVASLQKQLQGTDQAVLPWQDVLSDLAGFITVDMGSNYIFQAIILFLIGFTILNTILMSVLERTREFATLLAVGTSPRSLRLQIMVESLLLGLVGVGIGLALGGGISYYYQIHGIDFSSLVGEEMSVSGFAVDPRIYNYVSARLLYWVGGVVLGMTVLIGIYPSWRAPRINLPDTLRSK